MSFNFPTCHKPFPLVASRFLSSLRQFKHSFRRQVLLIVDIDFHLRMTSFLLVGRQVFCSLTRHFHLRTTVFLLVRQLIFTCGRQVFSFVGQLIFTCGRQVFTRGTVLFHLRTTSFYSWDSSFSLADDKFLLVRQFFFTCGRQVFTRETQVFYSWDS